MSEQPFYPAIIGLTGHKRTGKDTVAEWLRRYHAYHIISFATPIKMMASTLLSESEETFERLKDEKVEWLGCTRRHIAQTLGTEWGREMIHPDIWINIALRKTVGYSRCVFTDVRFKNEAFMLRQHQFAPDTQIWRIERPGCDGKNPNGKWHASECEVPLIDVNRTLKNNGTIIDLESQLRALDILHV